MTSRRISFMDRVSIASSGSDGGPLAAAPSSSSSGGGRRRSTFRPSLLHDGKGLSTRAFYNLDLEDFDSSLGCPLKSYDNATLALVGGKALQCWRLTKHGYPVPTAFIIPTYVYSLHVGEAGVAGLIQEVFASGVHNKAYRPTNEAKLETIRDAIMSTPLQAEVVDNLRTFLDAMKDGTRVAVRSSGSAEDLASQSFAGQYDTFLYKQTLEEVVESVKACWASMFKPHILDYAYNSVFLKHKSGSPDDPETVNDSIKAPKMGVLIMQMVEAKKAGVCFTQNLWGDADEIMVEAMYGQGEGLVSGEVTPDRYVLNKYSTDLVYQDLHKQTHKFVKASNMDGVQKVEITEQSDAPVLSRRELRTLTLLARSVEDFYSRPQDIEWAIDGHGDVYILQARPITTMGDPCSLSFIPPGEGFFTFDPTHFPRPLSPWMRESYSFDYCTPLSRKTGCLIESIDFRYVHGYAYSQPRGAPPSPALERAAEAYWSKKLYEDDYREFRDFFLPDTEILQEELRSVNPSSLSHKALVKHVARCFDLAKEFWKRHHTYSFPAMVIVGDFMNRMSAMCGKRPDETLTLLEGASPETRGLLNRQDPILAEMYDLLLKSDKAMALLKADAGSAAWALDCLLHFPGRLGEVMRVVRILYGWRLAGSYDLVTPALIETPHFFLQTILQGTQESPDAAEKSNQRVRALADEWKSALPEEKHTEFEEILDVGRRFFRMRDERGLFTDLSGVGLCRRGILEGGRRLCDQGVIFEAEHLCLATKREAIALLRGDLGMLGAKGEGGSKLDLPTPRELQRRYEYIHSTDPNLIPRALGTPPPPPDPMQLPPNIRRTMGAIFTGLVKGIWDEGQDEPVELGNDTVKGVAASMGITEGPVRLVTRDGELQNVRKGDIVVTYSCSASFNIVLGLCAGIVTDYGGMLSHAAICAREYGIPAIVGSQEATKKFKDGDYVRIDSSKGTVTRIRSRELKEISC